MSEFTDRLNEAGFSDFDDYMAYLVGVAEKLAKSRENYVVRSDDDFDPFEEIERAMEEAEEMDLGDDDSFDEDEFAQYEDEK